MAKQPGSNKRELREKTRMHGKISAKVQRNKQKTIKQKTVRLCTRRTSYKQMT